MAHTKRLAAAVLAAFVCIAAVGAAPRNPFAGKTYVATGFSVDGMDMTALISLASGMGMDYAMRITFTGQSTFSMDIALDDDAETLEGTYRITAAGRRIEFLGDDVLEGTYSEDCSQIVITGEGNFLGSDGEELVITFTEQSAAARMKAASRGADAVDYGAVRTNVFAGHRYGLSRIEINGQDVTQLFQLMMGFDAELTFISKTEVTLRLTSAEETESETNGYTIDYATNTIVFDDGGDEAEATYRENGTIITFTLARDDDMTLNLTFTRD